MRKTLVEQITEDIRGKIENRVYAAHARLPSIRALAAQWGVSKSTAVEAYDRLAAQGVIQARVGAGFYVCPSLSLLDLRAQDKEAVREIDPIWVARQSLDEESDMSKPGCGWLPAQWLYEQGIRQGLRKAAKADVHLLAEYAPAKGHLGLRQFLARRLLEQGTTVHAEQILITDSGTQAIDLIGRMMLCPGDVVVVDNPCYFNFRALLKAHQVQIVAVDYTAHGADPACFERLLRQYRPKLYLTNSAVHNPTGGSLDAHTAHQLLKLAEAYQVMMVEDDMFADFVPRNGTRLAAMDHLNRVIQVGSFSKTVSASVRCGYIAARADWLERLTDLKIATGFGSSFLAAELLLQSLTSSGYRKHLQQLHAFLAKKMQETVPRLEALGISPVILPEAGMFLWCRLPQGVSALQLTRQCFADQIVMAPGSVFGTGGDADGFVRINVAQMDDRVYRALRRHLAAG